MTAIKKHVGYFESFDGTKLYYEVRGEGKPIILCYGIGCLINHWVHQYRYFSQTYQTIVFDYRGHHRSDLPEDPGQLTLTALAKDLKSLVDHLHIDKKASFWGHSFGAQVLIHTYELFPEMMDHMIFINGFAKDPIRGMFGMDLVSQFFKYFKQSYEQYPEIVQYLWKWGVKAPLSIPIMSLAGGFNINLASFKDIEIYVRGIASMDLAAFTALFDEMLNYDGSPVLKNIKVPTLIISGRKDSVTPLDHQNHLHEEISNSQIQVIPYGSHCTQLDLPDFVNLRAEKFLKELNY